MHELLFGIEMIANCQPYTTTVWNESVRHFQEKLLLGIFSAAKAEDIRNALRSAWLTSRYVCPYYQYYEGETRTAEKESVIYYANQ